ncbi:hypothetical protein [Niveispirillum fermenti]|uniref:hypothetical protein n=1 Tax=Niveispirillum fermenti TaxID=1233113 RepID=UPI003A89DAC8
MRQFLRILMTSLPAGLCLAGPTWAGPIPVDIRVTGAVTELLIDSGDLTPRRFRRDQCGALLSLPLAEGDALDITPAAHGGGRIRHVELIDRRTLNVATQCSAVITIWRRDRKMVMTVAAPVTPGRKPAPPDPADRTASTPPPGAGQPIPPELTPAEAEFARKAVADGAREAMTPPVREPAALSATPHDPRLPDPAWGREATLVDLAAWRQGPFLATRDRLRLALAQAAPGDEGPLRDLVRFHLAWNRGVEALALVRERLPGDTGQPLTAIAAILADPRDPLADRVLTPPSLRAGDGPFWAAILLERRGQGRDAVRYLPAAARALPSLPPDLRRTLGLDLLSIAAEAGLDGMARAIARTLDPDATDPVAQARLHAEVGRLHAAAARPALALAQWDQAAALGGPAGAQAELAALALRVERGEQTKADRRTGLITAIRDWPGSPLEADSLWQLTLLEQQQGDTIGALEKLRLLALRFPDRPPAAMAAQADLAVDLFDGLAGDAAAQVPLSERITAFQRHRDLLPAEPAGWAVRRRFAAMLSAAGVQRAAREELARLTEQVPAAERAAIAHDLAIMELAAGHAAAALAALDGAGEDAAQEEIRRGRGLRARALLLAGDPDGALAAMGDAAGTDRLAIRAAGLWQRGEWGAAATAYKALAAEGPLPPRDAARLALAAMLAGDPAAHHILAGQDAALDGQGWADGLRLLARPVPAADAGEAALRGLLDDAAALGRLVGPSGAN